MSEDLFEKKEVEPKGPRNIGPSVNELLDRNSNFGALLSNLKRKSSRRIPTAGVCWEDNRFILKWNPDFWELCPLEQQVGILKHECYHIFMKHLRRRKDKIDIPENEKEFNKLDKQEKREVQKKANKWNIATDMAINPFIKELQDIDEDNFVMPGDYDLPKDRTAEWYYDSLPEDVGEPPQMAKMILPDDVDLDDIMDEDADTEGTGCSVAIDVESEAEDSGGGEGEDEGEDEGGDEEEDGGGGGESQEDGEGEDKGKGAGDIDEDRLKDSQLKEAVKKGGGSGRGTHPGQYKTSIDDLEPGIGDFPWQAYVKRFFRKCGDIHLKSRMKFKDRRYKCRPAIRAERRLQLLAGIDTSGSVEQWYIEKALSLIDPLVHYADVTIIQCDTQIREETEYDGKSMPDIKGRGGTDFMPVFNYYEENQSNYSGVIYFTDGYAPYPDKKSYPVLWIYPESGYDKCNWGMTTVVER